MKNKWLFIGFLLSGSLLITSGVNDITSNAAPLGSTGAPGENTCARSTCHAGSNINSGTGLLAVDFGSEVYEPNEVYNITVSLQQAEIHRFGYQLLALNSNNESAGTFLITDSLRTQTQAGTGAYEGRNYITYKYAGTGPYSNGVGEWSFQWKAPAVYEGDITFYAAAVAANNDGTDAGDSVYTKQLTVQASATGIQSNTKSKIGLNVFPNPASSFVQVKYQLSNISNSSVVLTDLDGRVVYSSVYLANRAKEQSATIPVSHLNAGVYLLMVSSGGKTETEKIIIEK